MSTASQTGVAKHFFEGADNPRQGFVNPCRPSSQRRREVKDSSEFSGARNSANQADFIFCEMPISDRGRRPRASSRVIKLGGRYLIVSATWPSHISSGKRRMTSAAVIADAQDVTRDMCSHFVRGIKDLIQDLVDTPCYRGVGKRATAYPPPLPIRVHDLQ